MNVRVSEQTKHIVTLVSELSSLSASDEVSVCEIDRLNVFIEEHLSGTEDIFVTAIQGILEAISRDGKIDEGERELIQRIIRLVDQPISNKPVEAVNGLSFVLTGDFEVDGGKTTAKEMIQAAGGKVKGSVSKKTDYVVAGARGSQSYAMGSFGSKIKEALGLQLKGYEKPVIVHESALMSFFETSEDTSAMSILHQKESRFERQRTSARVVSAEFNGLTAGQKMAFDLVKNGNNLFLSGLGGTGKSYILEKIIRWAEESEKNVIVCAPTGIAAINIGGSTIHRVLGISPKKTLQVDPKPFIPNGSAIPECDLLIVDEISMCRLDLFDYLSEVLQKAATWRAKDGKPPCQLIVVGDFLQLPPVLTKTDRPILETKYGRDVKGGYPFLGNEWESWNFKHVELTEAIRQRDASFVGALNACRVGDMAGVRWIYDNSASQPADNAIVLCGRNTKADEENRHRLNDLAGTATTYYAHTEGDVDSADKPTSDRLVLKPGARVMNLVNVSESSRMNGTLGTVLRCDENSVLVNFDGLGPSTVQTNVWEVTKPSIVDGRTKNDVVGRFEQIPLKLAWAITIHKAQGQTFNAAVVYPECWDSGQLYTAFSRLTSIEGLFIAEPVLDSYLVTSEEAIRFLEQEEDSLLVKKQV